MSAKASIMIVTDGRLGTTRGECWYSLPEHSDVMCPDIVCYYEMPTRLRNTWCSEFKTLWVDLADSEEEMFQKLKKDTRNEIRRAVAVGVKYEHWHSDATDKVSEFLAFFGEHSVTGGLNEARQWVETHARSRTLDLSCVVNSSGQTLSWHAYYVDGQRARLRFSVTACRGIGTPRSDIGRAHRYHHWNDMLRFKRGGFSTYDLGGWYPGRDNEKLLRVNRFKEEFGGVVVTLFNCIRPMTAGGYVYFIARSVKVALSSLMNPLQAKWETAGKE